MGALDLLDTTPPSLLTTAACSGLTPAPDRPAVGGEAGAAPVVPSSDLLGAAGLLRVMMRGRDIGHTSLVKIVPWRSKVPS